MSLEIQSEFRTMNSEELRAYLDTIFESSSDYDKYDYSYELKIYSDDEEALENLKYQLDRKLRGNEVTHPDWNDDGLDYSIESVSEEVEYDEDEGLVFIEINILVIDKNDYLKIFNSLEQSEHFDVKVYLDC